MDETKRALIEFARYVIESHAWGEEADGDTIHDAAKRLGLIKEVPYDPVAHGESWYALMPGDPWFVFADALKHQEEPQTEPKGESWTERSRALGRAGFDGGNSGRS